MLYSSSFVLQYSLRFPLSFLGVVYPSHCKLFIKHGACTRPILTPSFPLPTNKMKSDNQRKKKKSFFNSAGRCSIYCGSTQNLLTLIFFLLQLVINVMQPLLTYHLLIGFMTENLVLKFQVASKFMMDNVDTVIPVKHSETACICRISMCICAEHMTLLTDEIKVITGILMFILAMTVPLF